MLATNLNKFNQLRREERRLFVQAVLMLPWIHFGLTFLGYSRLYRLMERLVSGKPLAVFASETEILTRGAEIARMVNSAAQHGIVLNDPAKLHKDYQALKIVLPHTTLGL